MRTRRAFTRSGIEKLRQFDALAAKNLLEQATEADPKFPLAHAMLARAWSQLGYEGKGKEEAEESSRPVGKSAASRATPGGRRLLRKPRQP
jgi:Tfp pilus assembly protein PilF